MATDTMFRQLHLEIEESIEQLECQLKPSRTASQKERLQMLRWFKTGQVTQHHQLAARLGRDPYLVEDETRVELKTETGNVMTGFGVKPVAVVSWGGDNFWIDRVVEPLSEWHFMAEYPH